MTLRPIARALLSVSDKTGLIDFARFLEGKGVEILSTGGTAKAIREAGIRVKDVSEHTGFPEMLDGRVKTLHPTVHGGILGQRDNPEHAQAMQAHAITPIDLVVVNLYPFEKTIAQGADFETSIENIDIGGPAMIRSAAKNHNDVAVVVWPEDYGRVRAEMEATGGTTLELRQDLAARAFARTAAYDTAIAQWFSVQLGQAFPPTLATPATLKETLRYGENPHQRAAFYVAPDAPYGVSTARQVQGKELSYNNINDVDAAFNLVAEFSEPAVVIVKHANPCGVAVADSCTEAYGLAFATDPTSAFGGIVALNRPLDGPTAERITQVFTEVIIAPDADADALEVLTRKKNLRLLLTGGMPDATFPTRRVASVSGGYLVQDGDNAQARADLLKTVTRTAPTPAQLRDLLFAFTVCKHVKSNAIVLVKDGRTVGIGAGQMSRVDSVRLACWKAQEAGLSTQGAVLASDAFFPFADNVHHAAEAGVSAVIQPGGSIRDDEVIAAADDKGLAMVFTGIRHFRH